MFRTNDRHNKTTCRAQNSGRYLQGQGHIDISWSTHTTQPISLLLLKECKVHRSGHVVSIVLLVEINQWFTDALTGRFLVCFLNPTYINRVFKCFNM